MDGDHNSGGSERILRILSEIFDLTVDKGRRMDQATAEKSIRMTADKLAEICLDCRQRTPVTTASRVDPAAQPKKESEAPKRALFLLRLVTCKISSLFDSEGGGKTVDRSAIHGLDIYMKRIFEPAVYAYLDEQAKAILEVSGDDDATILNNLQFNAFHWAFLQNILVRIALSFKGYLDAKALFIADLNKGVGPSDPPVLQDEYRMIMGALLFDLFVHAKSSMEGALLDYQYGPKTAKIIAAVADNFGHDR